MTTWQGKVVRKPEWLYDAQPSKIEASVQVWNDQERKRYVLIVDASSGDEPAILNHFGVPPPKVMEEAARQAWEKFLADNDNAEWYRLRTLRNAGRDTQSIQF